ncbi:uncharacterized protein LOC109704742, partial [Ananas comosus]|uniref:Uncharacterized protein LOC109704742 n=1 Tax=Ananas comosus TaxID=4615 RepID=A0A6P5EI50_ANACO
MLRSRKNTGNQRSLPSSFESLSKPNVEMVAANEIMADRDEPLYAGLRIPWAPPILGRLAEPLVLFDGVRSKSLTVERRLRVAAFTSTHYINHGEEDVVLLEPLGMARERDAEILRAIIAFKGKYGKNPKLFKSLVELWCSETNTFHLPYGEVGISLWDIKELGGLSIIGEMYDAFVPSNSELKNYPCNLRQLLSVYEWLVNRRPAFLALWLCKFVMPSGKKDVIRPETFIMASQMAHGTRFALATAVLCAIQAALGRMVSDRRGPAYPYCRFPINFLFAWVGARFEKVYTRRPIREDIKSMPCLKKVPDMLSFMYAISTPFDSKRARQHLRDERNFIWRPYSFNCSGRGWVHEVIDMRGRSDFPEEVQEWIISLRHSVLPLRLGGSLYAQPYNPHRFARQFGLDQHFPKSSDVPQEAASTGVLAGYWLDLTQVSLSLKFFIPDSSRHGKPSFHYARWWTNSLYSYFQHGVNFLVERESCPKKKNEDLPEGPI